MIHDESTYSILPLQVSCPSQSSLWSLSRVHILRHRLTTSRLGNWPLLWLVVYLWPIWCWSVTHNLWPRVRCRCSAAWCRVLDCTVCGKQIKTKSTLTGICFFFVFFLENEFLFFFSFYNRTSLIRPPLYYGQLPKSRQNLHKFASLMRTTDNKSRPQRVNSYKVNLFITDTVVIRWIPNTDQVNLHRVNPVWLMSYARRFQKPSRCISNNDLRKVYRGT